jgi:hypothetical protein
MSMFISPLERAAFAEKHFRDRAGRPWRVRDYQRHSLNSCSARKVHRDGRDVGKTTEIEITAAWAMIACPGREVLVATQTENHLDPLMQRIARRVESVPVLSARLVEARRSPGWFFRFDNGAMLWGRIAGPRGVNFQGMHVDLQIVDEAQEMTETSWGELYQALNGGGARWVYGVPNGLRNTFYRMGLDPRAEHYHWPSTINPDFNEEKDAELVRLYGGRSSSGYIHRVLGEHGAPAHAVFSLDDYLACVDGALDFFHCKLHEGEPFAAPEHIAHGDYFLGCDLGFARDPSEFVIYLDAPPHLINTARVHLAGVNYARQSRLIQELDAAYGFRGIGIDCGNSGRAVAHQLMELGADWCAKVRAFEFGGSLETAPLADGARPRRRTKEFMTELLTRRMAERSIVFPRLADRESQYAAHTYAIGAFGHVVYEKGNDHIIDADRCAVLRHYIEAIEPETRPLRPGPGVYIAGF